MPHLVPVLLCICVVLLNHGPVALTLLYSVSCFPSKVRSASSSPDLACHPAPQAMDSIRTQLVKKEATDDKELAEKYKKHIDDEKKKVSAFFEDAKKR